MPFKKGQSGNPKGGNKPKLPPALRQEARRNKEKFKTLLLRLFNLTPSELKLEATRTDLSVIEHMTINHIVALMSMNGLAFPEKMLEIAVGKLVDDPTEFDLTDDECDLIREYRAELVQRKLQPALPSQAGGDSEETPSDPADAS